jgi:gliding motility associated protien GldN
MKKYICSLMVLVSGFAFSQTILNAKSPEEFRQMRAENKKIVGDSVVSAKVTPLKYGHINDNDIVKGMMVWEIIDMNDKVNQPFYQNNKEGFFKSSKSIYDVLLDAALSGELKEVYDDENFTVKLEKSAIPKRLESVRMDDAAIDIVNSGRQLTEAERKQYTDYIRTTTDKVRVLKIMGMWFVDKRDGMLKYRPLGIAALGPDPATAGQVGPDGRPIGDANELIDLFWIYYPDAREILANNYIYNRANAAADLSFDDIINMRRFSSVVYKSSNGLGDGVIKDYIPKNADEQIDESNRIKGQILEMENEMWNY